MAAAAATARRPHAHSTTPCKEFPPCLLRWRQYTHIEHDCRYADQSDAAPASTGESDGGYMDTGPAENTDGYMDLPVADDGGQDDF